MEALRICIRRDPIFTSGFRIQNIQCPGPSIFLSVPGLCWLLLCHSLPYLPQSLLASAVTALRPCQFFLSAPRMVPSFPQQHFRFKFADYPEGTTALCVLVRARWALYKLSYILALSSLQASLYRAWHEPISQQTGPFISNLNILVFVSCSKPYSYGLIHAPLCPPLISLLKSKHPYGRIWR